MSGTIVECFWFPSPPVYTFIPSLRSAEDQRNEKEICKWRTWNAAKPFYDLENGTWKEGGWVAERIRTVSLSLFLSMRGERSESKSRERKRGEKVGEAEEE